ncbi:hypothetical protein E2H86_20380 [Pseudomonas putida]|nr:hypothetical protein E2H86_20380 [Pseudomonas putida]
MGQLYRPFRGQARSHRFTPGLKDGMDPVGAGLPAKGTARITHHSVATGSAIALCWGTFQHEILPSAHVPGDPQDPRAT